MTSADDQSGGVEASDSGFQESPRFRRVSATLLVCYWGALFIGTHIPLPDLEKLPPQSDKLMHFGAYAGLSFLLGLWLAARRGFLSFAPLRVLTVTAIYGVIDELLQIPVNRSAEVADWMADVSGSVAGLLLLATVKNTVARMVSGDSEFRRP